MRSSHDDEVAQHSNQDFDLQSIESETSSTGDLPENHRNGDSSRNDKNDPVALNLTHSEEHSNNDHDSSKNDNEKSSNLQRETTLSSRVTFDKLKFIPKSERRGIGARFCLVPEYENPRELPSNVKFFLVFIVGFCAIVGPMGTSIILPAIDSVAEDLDTTVTIVDMSVGIYLILLGIAPLWWSNFSEKHGRRSIYIISFTLLCGFSIGCALSKSIGMLIGFRVLSGGCSASVQAVGAGTIGDLFAMDQRGRAMGIFYLGPLAGPLLAPIIGGALATKSWRATQWFLVAMAAASVILVFFFLPETLRAQDNREAIKKILRERRTAALKNKDEETQVDNQSTLDETKEISQQEETPEDLERQRQRQKEEEDLVIDRVQSNLSRQISRNTPQDEENEEFIDPSMPVLIKSTTKQSQKMKDYETKKLRSRIELAIQDVEQDEADQSNIAIDTTDNNDKYNNSSSKKVNRWTREDLTNKQLTKWQIFLKYGYIYGYSPLKSLEFFKYPPVCLAIIYSALCFCVLYFVNFTISYKYPRAPYNFSEVIVGLMYIPNSVTYVIASIWGGKYNDVLLEKKRKKYGIITPEARFGWNMVVAVILFPISLLIIGWCFDQNEFWITPLVGTALFGFASMLVIGTTVTYLVDSLPGRGATGIALSNFVRMILATVASFVTEPLIVAMGCGPLFSMLAGIIFLITGILIVLKKKGDHWRETYDLESLYESVYG